MPKNKVLLQVILYILGKNNFSKVGLWLQVVWLEKCNIFKTINNRNWTVALKAYSHSVGNVYILPQKYSSKHKPLFSNFFGG